MKYRMNLRIFAADATSIDRSGADALIPVQESNEIVQGIIAQSAVLSRGRRLQNMTAKQYKVPVLDMLPVAYFVNGDSGQKKTTKMEWDKKFLVAEEIAVIVPIPEAVLDDAEYDIWGEVRPRLQEAFGKVIDGAVLFGTNKPSSWRDGIVATATAANNVVTLPTSGTADLYDVIMGEAGVIAKVEEDGYFVNGHMADISMRAKLRGLRDEQGQPIFKSDMQSGTAYTLDGSPMNATKIGYHYAKKAYRILLSHFFLISKEEADKIIEETKNNNYTEEQFEENVIRRYKERWKKIAEKALKKYKFG
jgi:HK97 family phage major capsid protein